LLLRRLLRSDDRLVLTELHGSEHMQLKHLFAGDRQVAVHRLDAHQALKAFLPPKERRGFVLIDPAYELHTEYTSAVSALQAVQRRWPTGVYALWYPVLSHGNAPRIPALLASSGVRKMLLAELCLHGEGEVPGLRGAGIVLLNPPWHLQEQIESLLPWLWQALSPRQRGGYQVRWPAAE
jgi:23S rRNA (adenine2030-N6)-methyltransferase